MSTCATPPRPRTSRKSGTGAQEDPGYPRPVPSGIQGPAFNDEFGDVFGSIYAFTADGLTLRQLRDYVEVARAEVRDVPNIGKIELIGTQDEVLYLNFSTRKLAALGIDQRQVMQALQSQNAVTPAGVIEAGPERISVRTTGQFASERTCRPSTCGSTTASSASRISPISNVAMSIHLRQCSVTTARRPSALRSA